jgi:hypothetical protein
MRLSEIRREGVRMIGKRDGQHTAWGFPCSLEDVRIQNTPQLLDQYERVQDYKGAGYSLNNGKKMTKSLKLIGKKSNKR